MQAFKILIFLPWKPSHLSRLLKVKITLICSGVCCHQLTGLWTVCLCAHGFAVVGEEASRKASVPSCGEKIWHSSNSISLHCGRASMDFNMFAECAIGVIWRAWQGRKEKRYVQPEGTKVSIYDSVLYLMSCSLIWCFTVVTGIMGPGSRSESSTVGWLSLLLLGWFALGDGPLLSEMGDSSEQVCFVFWVASSSGLNLDEVSEWGERGLFVPCGIMEGKVGSLGPDAWTDESLVTDTES